MRGGADPLLVPADAGGRSARRPVPNCGGRLLPEPLLGRSVSYFYDPQRIDALLHSDAYTDAQKQDIRDALEFWKGRKPAARPAPASPNT